jgi:hypothetical protein
MGYTPMKNGIVLIVLTVLLSLQGCSGGDDDSNAPKPVAELTERYL